MFIIEQTWQKCSQLQPRAWDKAWDNWVDNGNPDVAIGDWLSMYWGGY